MTDSPLWLAQLQFFSSLGFMLIFLAMELGLAWVLLYYRLRSLGERSAAWTPAYRFWVRVFALAFILSFASGLPVLIQLGSLWPGLMSRIGDVAGPLLAAGILCAFIFKSCFLGAMLFGQRYLSDKVHAGVVFMVAVGVTVSSFWLVALVSWMHTPSGAALIDEQYRVYDWWAVLFNPALPWYLAQFLLASALTAAFLMLGLVGAQTLRRPIDESGRLVFQTAAWLSAGAVTLLIVATVGAGAMTAEHLPAKAAATAAYWHSGEQPDLILTAWPDAQKQSNRAALRWHHAGGKWLGHDAAGNPRGLDQFAGMMPPVATTFWSFRLAILVGVLMAAVGWITLWRGRRTSYDPAALSTGWRRVLVCMTFSGWLLLLAGLAHLLYGSYPYAITGTVTVREIAGSASFDALLTGYLAHLAFYLIVLAGFFQMLRHIARYGVIPVARRRGRA